MPRSSYHHGALREALLATAQELLAERGEETFSLNELARRVGVSSAAPYRHFADKDALLAALREEGYDRFLAALTAAAADVPDPTERVIALCVAYLRFAAEHRTLFGIMFRYRPGLQVFPESFTLLVDTVAQAQAAGGLPANQPPRTLARTVWATAHGLATLRGSGSLTKLDLDESPERLVREAFAAVGALSERSDDAALR